MTHAVTVDGVGNVYIADTDTHRVRKVDVNGFITTMAGRGQEGDGGDGGSATRGTLRSPYGVAVDASRNI